jgi:membrane-associated phospholipid phosphatase
MPGNVRNRFVAAALALLLVPFTALLLLVRDNWRPLRRTDLNTATGLHAYAVTHPSFVTAMRVLSALGTALAWTFVLGAVTIWLFWRRRTRLAIFVVVTGVGSSLLNNLVKVAVSRTRPMLSHPVVAASGFSFPSGHAQSAVVGCGIVAVVFLPTMAGPLRILAACGLAAFVAAIGFSRIALGVHYLSDVVAGYALGLAWLAAMIAAFDVWNHPASSAQEPPG